MNNDPETIVEVSESDDQKRTPFFARFLEGQEDAAVRTDVKAGAWPPLDQTMKYPSDSDEW